jgi:protein-tyrosine-phosphatase
MPSPSINVLFVSRRNTARSLLAEACLNHLEGKRLKAYSCGAPREVGREPDPHALRALESANIPSAGLASKDWSAFTRPGSRRFDFVIHLAPEVMEIAPPWPRQPVTALWSFADPLALKEDAIYPAMVQTLFALRRRIELFASLPLDIAERSTLRDDIRSIGRTN